MHEFQTPAFAFTDRQPLNGANNTTIAFPDDLLLVVIGDVHGQVEGFERALEGAARFGAPGKRRVLVLTGDLIDRGPMSFASIAVAATAAQEYGFDEWTYLPGNHELLMLDALDEMDADNPRGLGGATWLRNGGMEVLNEAFLDGWDFDRYTLPQLAQGVTARLPAINGIPYREALRAAPSHVRYGDVLCVHAGVNPDEPLGMALSRPQNAHLSRERNVLGFQHHENHWAWIRESFLYNGGTCVDGEDRPLLVIHGHTVARGADIAWLSDVDALWNGLAHIDQHGRICVDGGAARGTLVAGVAITSDGIRAFAAPCSIT